MSASINNYLEKAESFFVKLPDLYSKNAKSNNPNIQKAIDWAPSVIMAVGIYSTPYLAVGLGALALAGNIKKPEIITRGLMKNVLMGAALAIGAGSIVPVAKALLYSTTAIVSVLAASVFCFSSINFDDLKAIAISLKDKNVDEAKRSTANIFNGFIREVGETVNEIVEFVSNKLKTE